MQNLAAFQLKWAHTGKARSVHKASVSGPSADAEKWEIGCVSHPATEVRTIVRRDRIRGSWWTHAATHHTHGRANFALFPVEGQAHTYAEVQGQERVVEKIIFRTFISACVVTVYGGGFLAAGSGVFFSHRRRSLIVAPFFSNSESTLFDFKRKNRVLTVVIFHSLQIFLFLLFWN